MIPPVVNNLEDWVDEHVDHDGDLHRGMALTLETILREIERRRDAPFRGRKRWSREDLDEAVDLEELR